MTSASGWLCISVPQAADMIDDDKHLHLFADKHSNCNALAIQPGAPSHPHRQTYYVPWSKRLAVSQRRGLVHKELWQLECHDSLDATFTQNMIEDRVQAHPPQTYPPSPSIDKTVPHLFQKIYLLLPSPWSRGMCLEIAGRFDQIQYMSALSPNSSSPVHPADDQTVTTDIITFIIRSLSNFQWALMYVPSVWERSL